MFNLYNLRLRTQLMLIISVSIIMMIIVQLVFYVSFNSLTKVRALNYYNNILEQVNEQMLTVSKDLENIAFTTSYSRNAQKFLFEEDPLKRIEYNKYSVDNLDYVISSNVNIQSIRIVDRTGGAIRSNTEDNIIIYNRIIKDYELDRSSVKKAFFTRCYFDEKKRKIYYAYINPIFPAIEGVYSRENEGLCIITCKMDVVQQSIDSISLPPSAIFKIVDEDGMIIASNEKKEMGLGLDEKLTNLIKINATKSGELTFNLQKYLYQTKQVDNNNWSIISLIPMQELTSDLAPVRKLGIVLCVVTVVIISIIGVILIRSITKPISSIITGMEAVGSTELKYRLKIPGENEVGRLAADVNKMLERMEILTHEKFRAQDELFEIKLSQKQAELAFLQSQINPHFLYNSLECIRSIGLVYNATEIVTITTSMSKLFRYSLRKDDVVTVYDEIQCITDYFNIMSLRFGEKYQMDNVSISSDILNKKMIKMILQPIVENSLNHGFKNKGIGGIISIKGYYESPLKIIIEITDNGNGMNNENVEKLNEMINREEELDDMYNSSIGLRNINRRLKLKYGEDYGIQIVSGINQGTTVKIGIGSIM